MKYIILVLCLFLSGCVAFIPKKATAYDERIVKEYLNNQTLEPGTVEYFGENIYRAQHIYGRSWVGNTLGHFVIILNSRHGKVETHWSVNGEFPVLERRLFIETARPAL